MSDSRFIRPGRADAAFNGVVGWLTRIGIPLAGSRVLAVRGRSSGEWRTTPVNPLRVGGTRYLVAPRGNAQWVRNLRAAGTGELRHGRRVERFSAIEVDDAEKPPILRAYLKAWAWEVGRFFEGVDAHSPEERLHEIAPGFPVFRIVSAAPAHE
ncbi:deazaflavin-dependent oxidoreductase (nitroreductase family) [Microbacterium endophyticum]|uniref:Deazaflavin-dependent oxidoreductase (Nitroreductase family) n=1 Tax=Microbacterium endophyticum TaxID=1526412 RepID=A0A7W4YMM3_9MICO|nr:nitroreductase family deazaflavin-dependent oxidoreductase [Microbacterium endophyticum]MBB2975624.1 deazaflavin-dependent oxidoreductase (nitroreductase family) [Microbacterium endophyticum]NIK35357.1 deazaflavin-dependent oxidoreductase (nitroreductase family) [Microbacterium endophyticum]